MVTLRDLMNEIPEEQWDLPIILASDGEGNSYSPLSGFSIENYQAENTWSGIVGPAELTEELERAGFTEDDLVDGELSIVLGPVN
jgi:hypothetical protein